MSGLTIHLFHFNKQSASSRLAYLSSQLFSIITTFKPSPYLAEDIANGHFPIKATSVSKDSSQPLSMSGQPSAHAEMTQID